MSGILSVKLLLMTGVDAGRRGNVKLVHGDDDLDDSPLLAMFQLEEEQRHRQSGSGPGGLGGSGKKDVPHLSFEITSDDGFHVESDSLTSKQEHLKIIKSLNYFI